MARRAPRGAPWPARARPLAARLASCGATAGATAATSSTSAWRVLFVGVAASSAFQAARATSQHAPGQTARPSAATTSATSAPRRRIDQRDGDLETISLRRGARRAPRRQAGRACCARARLLPVAGRDRHGAGRALLRGRGDERGRRATPGLTRDLWTAVSARHRRAAPDHRPRRRRLRRAPRQDPAGHGGRAARARHHRARPALQRRPAAGDLPAHRLAAGRVDLDRRPDRLRAAG